MAAISSPNPTQAVNWLPHTLRLWSIGTLGMAVALSTHQSDTPTLLGRYSTLIAVMLVALFMLAGAAYGAAHYLQQHAQRATFVENKLYRWRTQRLALPLITITFGIAVGGVYLFFLGDHLPTYALMRTYIAFSLLLFALAILTGGSTAPHTRPPALKFVLPALLIPVVLAIFASAVMPPLLKTDEAFTLSMGVNLRDFGNMSPLIYKGIYADHYAWGGLWLHGLAYWMRVFGEGLAQGRHYILFAGGIATLLTGVGAARLYDRSTAGFSALIMAFMVLRLGYLRPDMWVALYLSCAFAAYAYAQSSRKFVLHVLTGFFIGLTIDAAPIGYLFGVGSALLYLTRTLRTMRQTGISAARPLFGLGIGGFAAIGVYLITRSGSSWFTGASIENDYFSTLLTRIRTLSPATDLNTLFLSLAPLTVLAIVGGIVLVRRTNADRVPLIVTGVWLGMTPFFSHYFPPFYAVHGLPFLSVMAAIGITRGITGWIRSATLPLNITVVLLTLWLSAWTASWETSGDTLADVVEAGRQIAQVLPPNATVVAAEPYYFGMIENFPHTFRGGAFEQNSVTIVKRQADTTWADLAPDYIVFSQNWPQEPARTPALLNYMKQAQFQRVGCWQTTAFGLVEVWGKPLDSRLEHLSDCPSSEQQSP